MLSRMYNININCMTCIASFNVFTGEKEQSEHDALGVAMKELITILSCHPKRAIMAGSENLY